MKLRFLALPVLAAFLALSIGCNGDDETPTFDDAFERDSKATSDTKAKDDGTTADDDGATADDDDGTTADDDGTTADDDDGTTADDDGTTADDDGEIADDDGTEQQECEEDTDCDGEPQKCHEFKCEDLKCKEVPVANNTACSDDNHCTENDTCQDGVCSGTAITCDDLNPCTEDTCDPESGCSFKAIDSGDTIICGKGECMREVQKCTDGVPNVCVEGEPTQEVCDGKDNDCDGHTDEEDADDCTTYYRDDDGDEFGVDGDTRCLCAAAAPYTATKGGDCCDKDDQAYPQEFTEEQWFIKANKCDSFDYNCSDGEEKRWGIGSCLSIDLPGGGRTCNARQGFDGRTPECGVAATYIVNCSISGGRCIATETEERTQSCR